MTIEACPLCGAGKPWVVVELIDIPVICNELWPDAQAARAAARGDVELVCCPGCSLMWNRAFEPDRIDYTSGYQNPLHFSEHFRTFAENLATRFIDEHRLARAHIIEIGCGDGYMLDLMVRSGAAAATGFDPSMRGKTTPFSRRNGVRIVPEYFRTDHLHGHFDALLCRHVLEHLEAPLLFVRALREAAGDRPVVFYFEVPSADWMLKQVSVWDVIYEHVTYWGAPALDTLLRRCGIRTTKLEHCYGGQFLMAEGVPCDAEPDYQAVGTQPVTRQAESFARDVRMIIKEWHSRFTSFVGTAAIWGAGSKGITFANLTSRPRSSIHALIDLNPEKQGLYVPGIALPVRAPEQLRELSPDLIIISNALYEAEIAKRLRCLGLAPDLEVLAH